jgi:hypothetical protein
MEKPQRADFSLEGTCAVRWRSFPQSRLAVIASVFEACYRAGLRYSCAGIPQADHSD